MSNVARMMNFPRGTIINGRFKLLERIGYGSFGVVYKGEDIKNNNSPVALKLEPFSHNNRTRSMLDTEYKAYCKLEGGPGIPKVFWFGVWKTSNTNPNHQETYSVLAMQLLGKSLHDLLKSSWFGAFRLRTVMVLAEQILEILQFVHSKFIAHRDIKPGNLVMGTGENSNKVYLIDFGLACSCAQFSPASGPKFQKHIPNTKSHLKEAAHTINGSLKYCSINAHYGRTLSRRDDLVSLGYMLLLLLNGKLPWSPLANKSRPDSAVKLVLDMKLAFDPNDKDTMCNSELSEFLQMAQNLAFEETPDYFDWRAKFIGVFAEHHLQQGTMSALDWDGSCIVGEAGEATCELSSTSKSSKVLVTL